LRTNTPTPLVGKRSDHFVTTRWSVILSCADAGGDEQKTRKALAELSKIYWRPVFAFICRQGHSVPDAQDLTQDFFVMVLKGRLLQHADRNRGRFRSIVLKALKGFLRQILKDARPVGSGYEKSRASIARTLSRAGPRRSCPNRRENRRNRGRTPLSVFGVERGKMIKVIKRFLRFCDVSV